MYKTLSPHYITTPFVSPATALTCTSYTLYVYVWKGLEASVPSTPSYQITKDNPTGSTSDSKISIARLVNDFISFTPLKATATSLLDSDNQVWVKTEVTYETTDPDDASIPQLENTELFIKGYGYGSDGENPETPTNKILISGDEFKVSRNSYYSLPIYTDGDSDSITVISYPDNEINEAFTEPLTTDSGELVRYVIVDLSETTTDEYIEIVYNSQTVTLVITEECRYTPIDIYFINKEGAQQSLTFFKALTEDMTVTDESFESDRGQPSLGNHQFVRYNVQAKSKFKVNSGYVDEDNNAAFKQLLLSERCWLLSNNTFTPLNVGSKSIEYKTRQKDRLINYEITFEYAYNEINNI